VGWGREKMQGKDGGLGGGAGKRRKAGGGVGQGKDTGKRWGAGKRWGGQGKEGRLEGEDVMQYRYGRVVNCRIFFSSCCSVSFK
jgi:hypothetical protein